MLTGLEIFDTPYAQKALVAVLLVALLGAAIGPIAVLRDLQFFTHAVGSGAYPAIVLSFVIGVAASLGALIGAALFAGLIMAITGRDRPEGSGDGHDRRDAAVGVCIAAALAVGAVLASTIGAEDGRLAVPAEGLLFGSILVIDGAALIVLALVAVVALVVALFFSERWIAAGFDPAAARSGDFALYATIALAVGAALPVTGSLLAPALLILPAAAARVFTDRIPTLVVSTLVLAILEGAFGLYLSLTYDLPTGAAIAALAGAVFVVAAAIASVRRLPAVRAAGVAALLLVAVLASGCGGSGDSSTGTGADERIRVVATTPQVADIVRHVAGDTIELETILAAGGDTHGFEPRASDLAALGNADVIFASGGDIDSWIAAAAKSSGTDAETVTLADSVRLIGSGEGFNAHWYLDPNNVASATQRVRDELVKADPPTRETFRAEADRYILEAEESSRFIRSCVRRLPEGDRAIVTGHDDFAYLADASGLQVAAQLTDSGESEPSARDVDDAVSQGRKLNARSVVVGRGEKTQLATRVAEALDVPLLELHADTLSPDSRAATLLGAINDNVTQIADAASSGDVDCWAGR